MKLLLTLFFGLFVATFARAQGLVLFHNLQVSALVTNALTGQGIVAGSTFKAALYYAPDSATPPSDSAFIQLGADVGVGPLPGHFNGGIRTTPASTAPGGPAYFQIRVWETAYGTTYEQAIAAPPQNGRRAIRGASNKVRVAATGSLTSFPPSVPPALTWSGLQAFGVTYPGAP